MISDHTDKYFDFLRGYKYKYSKYILMLISIDKWQASIGIFYGHILITIVN